MTDARAEALKQALKMEDDGCKYYLQAMEKVETKLAKDIFKSLAKAEQRHVKKITQLYKSLSETGEWPGIALIRGDEAISDNIFADAMSGIDEQIGGKTTDIEALKRAAQLEDDGIKYYREKADDTDDTFEKKFYLLMAREEGEHYISLLDTIEYLEDPQGYFSQRERGTMSF